MQSFDDTDPTPGIDMKPITAENAGSDIGGKKKKKNKSD